MNWFAPLDIGLTQGFLFVWAVLSFTVAFRLFDFPDLTVEGSVPLGAAVYAVIVQQGGQPFPAMVVALLSGGLAGALTGFLYVRYSVNKFLAGIIVVSINYSLMLRVMAGSNISLLGRESLFSLTERLNQSGGSWIHFGTLLLLFGITAVLLVLILGFFKTRLGIASRAVGSNPQFARSIGLNPKRYTILALAGCNCLAALSGVLLAMHQGFADVGSGQGVLILALAAMAIGESIVPKKKYTYHVFVVLAAVVGSVVYHLVVAVAVRFGLAPTDLRLATGLLVLFVVAFKLSRTGPMATVDEAR